MGSSSHAASFVAHPRPLSATTDSHSSSLPAFRRATQRCPLCQRTSRRRSSLISDAYLGADSGSDSPNFLDHYPFLYLSFHPYDPGCGAAHSLFTTRNNQIAERLQYVMYTFRGPPSTAAGCTAIALRSLLRLSAGISARASSHSHPP